jgi:hypothetical protein
MYWTKGSYLLNGSVETGYKPYLSLTGTSMAAPIVAGTAALMIQANPKLTPNLVKAIIQYTAQDYGYDTLSQGAGFLNTRGAVLLSRFYATAKPGQLMPMQLPWSKTIIWGNRKLTGGVIKPNGSAWATNVVWGTSLTVSGQNIVWGTMRDSDNIVWGTSLLDAADVVWGTMSSVQGENIVWGTKRDGDNIVWGTARNIVWGTSCGGANCDNIVWGTALRDVDNIVWGTQLDADNIVWGTSGLVRNIVWGTSSEADNVTWGCSGEETPPFDDPDVPSIFDGTSFDSLFPPEIAPEPVSTDPVGSIMTTTTTVIGGVL